jgi:hypothetical protein
MAVGFLAPTHVPIRLVPDCRACFASVSMVSAHLFRNAPTGVCLSIENEAI